MAKFELLIIAIYFEAYLPTRKKLVKWVRKLLKRDENVIKRVFIWEGLEKSKFLGFSDNRGVLFLL